MVVLGVFCGDSGVFLGCFWGVFRGVISEVVLTLKVVLRFVPLFLLFCAFWALAVVAGDGVVRWLECVCFIWSDYRMRVER
jgi:hypothetical protein